MRILDSVDRIMEKNGAMETKKQKVCKILIITLKEVTLE